MSVDELGELGVERMTDDEIREFLSNRRAGVLGLPTDGAPYLLPLSYGYDGGSRLFLTFVLGASSRKEELSDAAEQASFLVFQADTLFSWQSVSLTGTIDELPESAHDDAAAALADAWRPALLEDAALSRGVTIYQFDIDDRSGIKHLGLPPRFRED